jgi:AmmeMemoRadiSam system protein A
MPHPCLELAAKAVRYYLESGKLLPCPDSLPPELQTRAGTFVSIKKDRKLRGCIGTIVPTEKNLAMEIIHNAVNSATKDPRFSPVTKNELPSLVFSVDILGPPEKVENVSHLDCKKYGIIVKSGSKQGVLLPNLDGVNTVEEQIRICRAKANLNSTEPIDIYRFEVQRYS